MRRAEFIVREYIYELSIPECTWRMHSDRFKTLSYSRWSAMEILKIIQDNPDVPPVLLVEDFVSKMDKYSCIDKGTFNNTIKNSLIFSIAKTIGEDILDRLLSVC